MLFTIIIPLYNKENYIKRTVECVLRQTVKDFELIVVDDGSTDGSVDVVKSILDSRIRLIQQKNLGVACARNHGIRESCGRYICFLDADDLWENDFLQTVQGLFDEFPDAGMACPSYSVDYGDRVVRPTWKSVDLEADGYVRDFYEMATASFWICNSSCIAIKREMLYKLDHWFPEGETVYEDFDLWIRLGAKCKMVHSNKNCAVYQRITQSNARKSHTNKIVYSKSYMETLEVLLSSKQLSKQQIKWIQEIRDRRMVPYIFSLILLDKRKTAKEQLKKWNPCIRYRVYQIGLKMCNYMPRCIVNIVQKARMRIF